MLYAALQYPQYNSYLGAMRDYLVDIFSNNSTVHEFKDIYTGKHDNLTSKVLTRDQDTIGNETTEYYQDVERGLMYAPILD